MTREEFIQQVALKVAESSNTIWNMPAPSMGLEETTGLMKNVIKIQIQAFVDATYEVIHEGMAVTSAPQEHATIGRDIKEVIKELLSQSVMDCGLSIRTSNYLKANDIFTVADIVSLSADELKKIKCFGKRSYDELTTFLLSKGLRFGMNPELYGFEKRQWNDELNEIVTGYKLIQPEGSCDC